MGRFVVVVLDGFGVGYMEDAESVRPRDVGANTFRSIADFAPGLRLPTLEKLGLMNIAGFELAGMKYHAAATVGTAQLAHYGADTFWGHQEIMGTRPLKPAEEPLAPHFDRVRQALEYAGFAVREHRGARGGRLLIVNEAATVADNIECDPGLAVNITAALDDIPFDQVVRIGRVVREHTTASRVIAFGGSGVRLNHILAAVREKPGGYIGVSAPDSGVYERDYHCVHMGFGVDPGTQLPAILHERGIPSFLLGKAADIVGNSDGSRSFPIVPTPEVLDKTVQILRENGACFICANVQETDLCGHRQNPSEYLRVLEQADRGLAGLIAALDDGDILVVMADHGNDPCIGHPNHTRERVPLMFYGKTLWPADIGVRGSLSDVAATAAEYFGVRRPQNGEGFLALIKNGRPGGIEHAHP